MEQQTTACRVAENQHAFRQANERIETYADHVAGGKDRLPFLCECPRRRCVEIVRLPRDEYELVRARADTFLVAPGHEVCVVAGVRTARVVERFGHFSLMAKIGAAGERVQELDDRSRLGAHSR